MKLENQIKALGAHKHEIRDRINRERKWDGDARCASDIDVMIYLSEEELWLDCQLRAGIHGQSSSWEGVQVNLNSLAQGFLADRMADIQERKVFLAAHPNYH